MSDRIAWPDAARGMAIVLVVLHHAVLQTVEIGLAEPEWSWITEGLRTMRMPLFFMAAGLFASKWIQHRSWGEMLQNKVLLLLWVFALWVPIRWAWLNLIPGFDPDETLRGLIVRFFAPTGGWFLVALAVFFIVAKATRRIQPVWQLAAASVVSATFFAIYVGNVGWNGILTFYVFFLLGCYWRSWLFLLLERTPTLARVGVLVAWPLAVVLAMWFDVEEAPVISFALRILGLAGGVILAAWFANLSWLRSLGQNTLPIYMSHSLVVMGIVWIMSNFSVTVPVISPLLVGVLALVISDRFGRLAPRIGLPWLFAAPGWLLKMFGRLWPASKVTTTERRGVR